MEPRKMRPKSTEGTKTPHKPSDHGSWEQLGAAGRQKEETVGGGSQRRPREEVAPGRGSRHRHVGSLR